MRERTQELTYIKGRANDLGTLKSKEIFEARRVIADTLDVARKLLGRGPSVNSSMENAMTIHQSCRLALTLGLALLAPSLFAGEIALFDGENFQGANVVFRDAVPDLEPTGFNDRAASISVRDGTWEVCFDANFQGACMRLAPGDYSRLDPPFNDSISSLRQVDGAEYGGNYPAPAPQVSLGFGVPGISIGINLPLYPELVPVPGYPVYYAPQVDSNYFFYDGMYWVYQRDNWYASSWYNGPWGLIGPEAVPLFVLRVPVRYYRQPPAYFRGWSPDAPPRWGDHWSNSWTQSHRGWDNWNRNAVPAPAPLPSYQQQYSGNRYPVAAQQRALQSQNYRYQPRDPVVRQHYQTQQGAAPVPPGKPPQSGGGEVQRSAAPAPSPQGRSTAAQPQAQQPPQKAAQRQQQAPKAQPQAQQPQQKAAQRQQQAPTAQPKPQQAQQKAAQRQQQAPKAQPQPQQPQQKAAQRQQQAPKAQPRAQQPQQGAAQRPQEARKAQGQAKEPQGKGPAKEPKQDQEQRDGKGQ